MRQLATGIVAILSGCTVSGPEPQRTIDIDDGNAAGVTRIEIDQDGDNFEVRGLDGNGGEVVSVRRRIGTIPDLAIVTNNAGDFGSEVIVSAGDFTRRWISLETRQSVVYPTGNPTIEAFTQHEVVKTVLHDAQTSVIATAADRAYFYTVEAPSEYFLFGWAREACWTSHFYTLHINDAGVASYRNGPGTPCTSSTGGACSGSSCYFGPFGFARASFGGTGNHIRDYYGECAEDPYVQNFLGTSGNNQPNQGCPGGFSGAGQWDY